MGGALLNPDIMENYMFSFVKLGTYVLSILFKVKKLRLFVSHFERVHHLDLLCNFGDVMLNVGSHAN